MPKEKKPVSKELLLQEKYALLRKKKDKGGGKTIREDLPVRTVVPAKVGKQDSMASCVAALQARLQSQSAPKKSSGFKKPGQARRNQQQGVPSGVQGPASGEKGSSVKSDPIAFALGSAAAAISSAQPVSRTHERASEKPSNAAKEFAAGPSLWTDHGTSRAKPSIASITQDDEKSVKQDQNPMEPEKPSHESPATPVVCQVFVSNLPPEASSDDVEGAFSRFGDIEQSKLFIERRYGFITYMSPAAAQLAVESMSNQLFQGKALKVRFAKPAAKDASESYRIPRNRPDQAAPSGGASSRRNSTDPSDVEGGPFEDGSTGGRALLVYDIDYTDYDD